MALDIVILHGPIGSGKTTRLAAWCAGRKDVAGILQPDGPHGRKFFDIVTGVSQSMEEAAANEATIDVGRFRFRAAAFAFANATLSAVPPTATTVIVDEIGPLELRGGGLLPGTRAVLTMTAVQVVLVVRDALVADVRAHLDLAHARIAAAENWPQQEQVPSSAP